MTRADYTYSLENYTTHKVVVIEDLDLGNMSVTNDIENVVAEIVAIEKIDLPEYMIVYKDSENVWDGYNAFSKSIVALTEDTWQNAVTKYAHKLLTSKLG